MVIMIFLSIFCGALDGVNNQYFDILSTLDVNICYINYQKLG